MEMEKKEGIKNCMLPLDRRILSGRGMDIERGVYYYYVYIFLFPVRV